MDDQGVPRTGEGGGDPFGAPPEGTPWQQWLALPLLGAVLAVLIVIDLGGGLWSGAPGTATAGVAGTCGGSSPPEVLRVGAPERLRLRSVALAVMDGHVARLYEQGTVGSANLWTDNRPRPGADEGTVPGGYEARWWALDSEGRTDDVVVDVLRYRGSAQARRALALAAGTRCRREGSAGTAAFPAGARTLSWLNPDGVHQHDTLLVDGPYLYRVSDVPPGTGEGAAGIAQAEAERRRVAITTDVLACGLPAARCGPAVARTAAELGMPALARSAPPASWPATPAQAQRFLHALSLRAYDVPYMSAQAGAAGRRAPRAPGPVGDALQLVAGCARLPPGAVRARVSSPVYAVKTTEQHRSVRSFAWLLADESAAARAQARLMGALSGGCVQRGYRQRFRRLVRLHPDVLFGRPQLSPLPATRPEAYPSHEPYRASAERVSFEVLVRTRNTPPGVLHFYADVFAFAYRSAVVVLATATASRPLPDEDRAYLESALAGRAVANWGAGD